MRELVLSKLKGAKRVLILGYGREGHSTLRWFGHALPDIALGIADKNEALAGEFQKKNDNVALYLGPHYLDAADTYEVIVKSPGIALPDRIFEQKTVLSQTSLFLEKFRRQIIGITGTKGKSTTAALTAHILNRCGKAALLLGNIGTPAFDMLPEISPETTVVYELSGHQLRDVNTSPHIAVLTNIFPEHLDFFKSFEAYARAKRNNFRFQTPGDVAIDGTLFQQSDYNDDILLQAFYRFTGASLPLERLKKISPLKGKHNLFNAILAIAAAHANGISINEALEAVNSFRPLPHRLEYAGTYGGITFFNDSISTVPQSAVAAVKSIGKVDVLLLGGYDRGIDYSGLAAFLAKEKIPYLFFLGKAGKVMYELLKKTGTSSQMFLTEYMEEAMKKIKSLPEVKTVLLSPAAASYDAFHNFEHRGDTFKALVKKYFNEEQNYSGLSM